MSAPAYDTYKGDADAKGKTNPPGPGPVMTTNQPYRVSNGVVAPVPLQAPGYNQGGYAVTNTTIVQFPPSYDTPGMSPHDIAENMPSDVPGFHNWPASTPGRRVIVDLEPSRWWCCGPPALVVSEQTIHNVPPEVAARGLSQEVWETIMTDLQSLVRRKNMSICSHIACILLALPIWCCVNAGAQKSYGAWVKKVNAEHFEPKGMLLKLQSSSFEVNNEKGETQYREEAHWIAIAIHPVDVEGLREMSTSFAYNPFNQTHTTYGCCGKFCNIIYLASVATCLQRQDPRTLSRHRTYTTPSVAPSQPEPASPTPSAPEDITHNVLRRPDQTETKPATPMQELIYNTRSGLSDVIADLHRMKLLSERRPDKKKISGLDECTLLLQQKEADLAEWLRAGDVGETGESISDALQYLKMCQAAVDSMRPIMWRWLQHHEDIAAAELTRDSGQSAKETNPEETTKTGNEPLDHLLEVLRETTALVHCLDGELRDVADGLRALLAIPANKELSDKVHEMEAKVKATAGAVRETKEELDDLMECMDKEGEPDDIDGTLKDLLGVQEQIGITLETVALAKEFIRDHGEDTVP
ncbi:hypothetical protein HK101_011911 [Irineochytrium annulatum]|nr:hypothetical protein HK101_011911 [Irineochytrium annulatum]